MGCPLELIGALKLLSTFFGIYIFRFFLKTFLGDFFYLCCIFCKLREKYEIYFNFVFCIQKKRVQCISYRKLL